VLVAVAIGGIVIFAGLGQATPATATLTIYEGTAQLQHSGGAFAAAHSGQGLAAGDAVQTGADTKAAITFADGSITRLDHDTTLQVKGLTRNGGGVQVDLVQSAGKTWNRVSQLVGSSTFQVHGPNNSTAEVRGTEFSVVVEKDPKTGKPIVRINCFSGSLLVSAGGKFVSVSNGESTVITGKGPPSPPAQIPANQRNDGWTVFNTGADVVSGSVAVVRDGFVNQGDVVKSKGAFEADGNSDLQFVLSWPGSTFRLLVLDPQRHVYREVTSSQPPLSIAVPGAAAGPWTWEFADVQSAPGESWAMIVAKSPGRPRPSATPTPNRTPTPTASTTPIPSGTPTPSATPTPIASAIPTPTSTATPNATPPPQVPTVAFLSPATGASVGGTSVLLTGTHLLGATGVAFGTAVSVFTVLNDTSISATSPAGAIASLTTTARLGSARPR